MLRTSTCTVSAPRRRAGAAAVHRGVAAAQHQHLLADFLDVPKAHRGQPVDADMDSAGRGLPAPGQVQIASARCAAAHEHGVIALRKQLLHRFDALAGLQLHAQVQMFDLLVDHLFRQAEAWHLAAHEAAALGLAVEHGDAA
ncbi:MAG: hypothetical protein U1E77_04860 [Inhella sp.]